MLLKMPYEENQNATKHGGYSTRIVIRGESQEIYDALHLAYWNFYKPENPSEADAVEDIINTRWKIRRFESIEHSYLMNADTQCEDYADYHYASPESKQRISFNHLIENQPGFLACSKFLERYQRANARALRNLDRIRKKQGKAIIESAVNEIEKDYPSNNPTPQEPEPIVSAKKQQDETGNPVLRLIRTFLHLITQSAKSISRMIETKETKLSGAGFHTCGGDSFAAFLGARSRPTRPQSIFGARHPKS